MSYQIRSYDNGHGDPVVVMVVTGVHDVSRIVQALTHGNCEQAQEGFRWSAPFAARRASPNRQEPGVAVADTMNAIAIAQAARRAAATIATDPEVRHYSPETIALVLKRTIVAFVAAGSWDAAATNLSTDTELDGVPLDAVTTIAKASLVHFARALDRGSMSTDGEGR